jgi:four helix bundle suffix protein
MRPIGPIPPPGKAGPEAELRRLLRDPAPHVRALAARLAAKLDLGCLRPELEELRGDPDPLVCEQAAWALSQLAPGGGRGGAIVRPHGGYASLKAYQSTEIVCDGTVVFCRRFIPANSRTRDQMDQAARSGKQNIVEASAAAGTSSKTELKLTGVARASLEEPLEDYKDYLRQHGLALWDKNDPRALAIRKLAYAENRSYATYRSYFEEGSAEVAANTAICLINQATFLLDRLIKQLDQAFVEQGGVTERMYNVRKARRAAQER